MSSTSALLRRWATPCAAFALRIILIAFISVVLPEVNVFHEVNAKSILFLSLAAATAVSYVNLCYRNPGYLKTDIATLIGDELSGWRGVVVDCAAPTSDGSAVDDSDASFDDTSDEHYSSIDGDSDELPTHFTTRTPHVCVGVGDQQSVVTGSGASARDVVPERASIRVKSGMRGLDATKLLRHKDKKRRTSRDEGVFNPTNKRCMGEDVIEGIDVDTPHERNTTTVSIPMEDATRRDASKGVVPTSTASMRAHTLSKYLFKVLRNQMHTSSHQYKRLKMRPMKAVNGSYKRRVGSNAAHRKRGGALQVIDTHPTYYDRQKGSRPSMDLVEPNNGYMFEEEGSRIRGTSSSYNEINYNCSNNLQLIYGIFEVKDKAVYQCSVKLKFCRLCGLLKPLRTKHCHDCERCVCTHDHHCPWIGTCVGERNRKFYILYLQLEFIELLWIALAVLQQYLSPVMLHREAFRPALLIVTVILWGLLFTIASLLLYHYFLAAVNLTTWEHIAWNRVSYLKDSAEHERSPFSMGVLRNMSYVCCAPSFNFCTKGVQRSDAFVVGPNGELFWRFTNQPTYT